MFNRLPQFFTLLQWAVTSRKSIQRLFQPMCSSSSLGGSVVSSVPFVTLGIPWEPLPFYKHLLFSYDVEKLLSFSLDFQSFDIFYFTCPSICICLLLTHDYIKFCILSRKIAEVSLCPLPCLLSSSQKLPLQSFWLVFTVIP